jgi:hypothetical protein
VIGVTTSLPAEILAHTWKTIPDFLNLSIQELLNPGK